MADRAAFRKAESMATAKEFVARVNKIDGVSGCLLIRDDGALLGQAIDDPEIYSTLLVLGIVFAAPSSVFQLVIVSWSALGAGLGPLMLVRLFLKPPPAGVAVAMMLVGCAVSIFWGLGLGWTMDLYELLPAMLAGAGVYGLWYLWHSFGPARATTEKQNA